MNVGDPVLYVPDVCHAMIPDPITKTFPFVMGVKERKGKSETVRELSRSELLELLRGAKRASNDTRLIIVRPAVLWPGIVTAVNDDGTVDIHVKHRGQDNDHALDCSGVKIEMSGKVPHTCHPTPDMENNDGA